MNATLQCLAHAYPDLHVLASRAEPSQEAVGLGEADLAVWKQDCTVALAYHDLCSEITRPHGRDAIVPRGVGPADTTTFRNLVTDRVEVVVPSRDIQLQEDAHQFLVMPFERPVNADERHLNAIFTDCNAILPCFNASLPCLGQVMLWGSIDNAMSKDGGNRTVTRAVNPNPTALQRAQLTTNPTGRQLMAQEVREALNKSEDGARKKLHQVC